MIPRFDEQNRSISSLLNKSKRLGYIINASLLPLSIMIIIVAAVLIFYASIRQRMMKFQVVDKTKSVPVLDLETARTFVEGDDESPILSNAAESDVSFNTVSTASCDSCVESSMKEEDSKNAPVLDLETTRILNESYDESSTLPNAVESDVSFADSALSCESSVECSLKEEDSKRKEADVRYSIPNSYSMRKLKTSYHVTAGLILIFIAGNYLMAAFVLSDITQAKKMSLLEFDRLSLFIDTIVELYIIIQNAVVDIDAIAGTHCLSIVLNKLSGMSIVLDSFYHLLVSAGTSIRTSRYSLKSGFREATSIYDGLWSSIFISSAVCVFVCICIISILVTADNESIKFVKIFQVSKSKLERIRNYAIYLYGYIGIIAFAVMSSLFLISAIILTDFCIDPVQGIYNLMNDDQNNKENSLIFSVINHITGACTEPLIFDVSGNGVFVLESESIELDKAVGIIRDALSIILYISVDEFDLSCNIPPRNISFLEPELSVLVSSVSSGLDLVSTSCVSTFYPAYTYIAEEAVCEYLNKFLFMSSICLFLLSVTATLSMFAFICFAREKQKAKCQEKDC